MFDTVTRRWCRPLVAAVSRPLVRRRVDPDVVTGVSLLVGLGAAAVVAAAAPLVGLALFGVNRLLDGVDGELARRHPRPGTWGGVWDFTADVVIYVSIPLAFAVADDGLWPAAAVVCAVMAVNLVTVLAAPNLAAEPSRSVRLGAGLVEGTETIAVYAVLIAVPAVRAPGLWGFAAAVALTAAWRLVSTRRPDRSAGPASPPAP